MLIVNADDLGRSPDETHAALSCHALRRITSASAMVFMADSERAADLTRSSDLDVGLHLNLDESFTSPYVPAQLRRQHECIARFLNRGRYALLLYNPLLRRKFRDVYEAQETEFVRLYGKPPSHVDGHRHMHLCTNMLVDRIIPTGRKVRRSFTFYRGEKGFLNRAYRDFVDRWLQQRYSVADYFFSLRECLRTNSLSRVAQLSKTAKVELMTHPKNDVERTYLLSDDCNQLLAAVQMGTYAQV